MTGKAEFIPDGANEPIQLPDIVPGKPALYTDYAVETSDPAAPYGIFRAICNADDTETRIFDGVGASDKPLRRLRDGDEFRVEGFMRNKDKTGTLIIRHHEES